MAHDWYLKHAGGADSHMELEVSLAWKYADAMQAEADKREEAERQQKRKDIRELLSADNTFLQKEGQHFDDVADVFKKDKEGNCLHTHTTFGGGECFDCGDVLKPANSMELEWQPDWSQAPTHDTVAWDIDERGQARWIASDNGYYLAPTFGYTGRWQDSLRKRPK